MINALHKCVKTFIVCQILEEHLWRWLVNANFQILHLNDAPKRSRLNQKFKNPYVVLCEHPRPVDSSSSPNWRRVTLSNARPFLLIFAECSWKKKQEISIDMHVAYWSLNYIGWLNDIFRAGCIITLSSLGQYYRTKTGLILY